MLKNDHVVCGHQAPTTVDDNRMTTDLHSERTEKRFNSMQRLLLFVLFYIGTCIGGYLATL